MIEETPDQDTKKSQDDSRIESASAAIGSYIVSIAVQAEQDLTTVTDGWINDQRQLNGLTLRHFQDSNTEQEEYFEHRVNITKEKTLTAEARISDMLFQMGDKNFSVTPDKDIPADQRLQQDESASAIEKRIVDVLDDSDYDQEGRLTIKSACEMGVGVLKGPVKKTTMERHWVQMKTQDGRVINKLKRVKSTRSEVKFVPLWDYLPDTSPARHQDCEYEFQRHWMTKMKLQNLLLRDDFNRKEILEMLEVEPVSEQPRYLTELRSDKLPVADQATYKVYEGYVNIPRSMVQELCQSEPEREGNHFEAEDCSVTDNFEIKVLAWVSESGRLLKFSPSPLETDERPFSVFCYDRDTSCFMASKGIPRLLRDAQRDANVSWDRANVNADLSVGPQYVVDPFMVEPIPDANGKVSWEMEKEKGWRMKRQGGDPSKAIHFFNVPSGIEENMLLLDKSLEFADNETQLPEIAGGQQSARMTDTFSGMELLINESNTVQRRIVKDWDDNITVPLIRRMIDDVMQNSPMPGVFGRFIPNAKGTSSLMLKETMANNAMNVSKIATSVPPFAQLTNFDKLYDKVLKGLQFAPDEVKKSEDELKAESQQPKPPDAKMIEAQARLITAQNEKSKLEQGVVESSHKIQLENRELDLKAKKYKADTTIAMMKLDLMRNDPENKTKGKVIEESFKAKGKEKAIKLKARADESKIVAEALVERNGEVNI